jgi:hypothetical protein
VKCHNIRDSAASGLSSPQQAELLHPDVVTEVQRVKA